MSSLQIWKSGTSVNVRDADGTVDVSNISANTDITFPGTGLIGHAGGKATTVDTSALLAPYLTAALAETTYVPRAGGTMTGNLVVPEVLIGGLDGPRINRSGSLIRFRNNANTDDASISALGVSARGVLSIGAVGAEGSLFGGANRIEQRNGTNPQTFLVNNTWTDGSNFERGHFRWVSNVLQIGTEKAGTGSARPLTLQTDGVNRVTIAATGNITVSQSLTAIGDVVATNLAASGIVLLADGTNANPSLTFTNDQDTGLVRLGNGILGWSIDGSNRQRWDTAEVRYGSGMALSWSSSTAPSAASADVRLSRNAAGVLQVGTTANNALGSMILANLTAGEATFSGINANGNASSVAIQMQSGQAIRSVGGFFVDFATLGTGDFHVRGGSGFASRLLVANNGNTDCSPDQDVRFRFGRAVLQSAIADNLYLSHFDHATTTGYAVRQQPAGGTVINSASGQLLQLAIGNVTTVAMNDTQFIIGNNPAIHSSIFGFDGAATTAPINAGRGLGIYGRNTLANGVLVAIGGEPLSHTTGSSELLRVTNAFNPTSGNANHTFIRIVPSINQTGGATGVTRGVSVEPSALTAADWRSFDTNVNSGFAYHSSGTAPSRFGGNIFIGNASITPVARLQIRGAGATSATSSLIVEDSTGQNWLSARDDRIFNISGTQSWNNGANISPSAGADTVATGFLCGLRFRSVLNLADPLSEFFFRNVNGNRSFTSSLGSLMEFSGGFAPTSGTGTYAIARFTGTINQTGGANGITQGVLIAPNIVAAADWRSFDTNVNTGFAYHSSGTAPSRLGGNLTIETDVVSNAAYTASTPTAGTNRQIHYRFMRTSADFLASLTAAWRGGTASNRVNLEFYAGGDSSNPPMTVRGSANSSFVALGSNYQLVWADTTNSSTGTANLGIQRAGDGIMLLMANNEFRFQNLGATSWTPMQCGHITSSFQSLSTDPTTIDLPSGFHRRIKNTTSGEVRDWVNDGGVMKKSPAYT